MAFMMEFNTICKPDKTNTNINHKKAEKEEEV